jgi:hypothetical protein
VQPSGAGAATCPPRPSRAGAGTTKEVVIDAALQTIARWLCAQDSPWSKLLVAKRLLSGGLLRRVPG